jgi:hypothetical protein
MKHPYPSPRKTVRPHMRPPTIPKGADSAAFAVCMLSVKIPSICSRLAAAVSAQVARRDVTPQGIVG